MAKKIKLGTPIKGFKNVKTGEIKTYEEWVDEQEPKEKNRNDAGCVVDMMIFGEDLIPVVDEVQRGTNTKTKGEMNEGETELTDEVSSNPQDVKEDKSASEDMLEGYEIITEEEIEELLDDALLFGEI